MKFMDAQLRKTILDACRVLDHYDLVRGYGHVSSRSADGQTILITPRKALGLLRSPREILHVDLDGRPVASRNRPRAASKSSAKLQLPLEYFLHTEIYRARPEVKAIARVHGKFALVLSVLRRTIRPVHELTIPVGPQVPLFESTELISSPEIGRQLVKVLGQARALLLRGNGQLVTGETVEETVVDALHMESSAEIQWRALQIGEPAWISGNEFAGEYAKLAKRQYESVLRPWEYYVAKSRGR